MYVIIWSILINWFCYVNIMNQWWDDEDILILKNDHDNSIIFYCFAVYLILVYVNIHFWQWWTDEDGAYFGMINNCVYG